MRCQHLLAVQKCSQHFNILLKKRFSIAYLGIARNLVPRGLSVTAGGDLAPSSVFGYLSAAVVAVV